MSDEYEEFEEVRRTADSADGSLWDSDEAIESLRTERTVMPDETYEQMTRRLLEQAAPLAANRIIHIAVHGQNENTALSASKYITDWLREGESGNAASRWEKLMAGAIDDLELEANTAGPANPNQGRP